MRRAQWLKLQKKTDPELPLEPPIRLGSYSNGELFHEQTPLERKIRKEILVQADEKARKLGIDRREFLASALGMTTSLSVLNLAACAQEEAAQRGSGSSGAGGAGYGGSGSGTGGYGGSGSGTGGYGGSGSGTGGTGGYGGASPGAGGAWNGAGGSSPGGGGASPGAGGSGAGGYQIPPDATMDCDLAEDVLGGSEFIFDIQTHHVEREGS